MLLLGGLILRGVAFEFREKSVRLKPLWDLGFGAGSFVAAFVQGCAVGALVMGLPNSNGRFTGGAFFWAQPFPVLCGIGLSLGYALIGASWLTKKTDGELRDRSYKQALWLTAALVLFLVVAFIVALELDLAVLNRWVERPFLAVFPIVGVAGGAALMFGLGRKQDNLPFVGAILLFIAAYGTLGASFLPYMVPFSITIADAAAPPASLSFLFWFAGIIVLPLILVYTAVSYSVFRGKVHAEADRY